MQYRTANYLLIRNRLLAAVLLSVVATMSGCAEPDDDRVLTITGERISLTSADWLVVNYWAEWCGPCRHEIPELNELDGPAPDVPGNDASVTKSVTESVTDLVMEPIRVLGVNYDGLRDEKLMAVARRMGIEFTVLVEDPRLRWEQPLPQVLPSTYLIAPGGKFVETLVGPQTRAGIISRIQTLAAQDR